TTTTTHKKHRKHKKHYRHHHRAQNPAPAPEPVNFKADYKGEVAAPCPTCPAPFMAGAYLGLSVGSIINYTTAPAVYNGLEGTLFGGYGWLWDQVYGGLEIFVQDSVAITNNTSALGSAKSTWGYGLSILPGYLLTDNVLGYLRLGVARTRFSTGNSTVTGGQLGLGLDTALCNNWDLRGEYVYSFYNSLSNHGGSPKSQQFNLGLIYKFQM
ncbi:MAG TPA: outer membrane beta-barrel protein, partial [Gammaproteobacteria bacterium]|nr:outer membrane beta-barrel protein [Gammaproteobacteria bacterium]